MTGSEISLIGGTLGVWAVVSVTAIIVTVCAAAFGNHDDVHVRDVVRTAFKVLSICFAALPVALAFMRWVVIV
jgi:hypothetical protein